MSRRLTSRAAARHAPITACAALFLACAGEPADEARADTSSPAPPGASEWVVTPAGIGPVRVGMTLAEARAAAGAAPGWPETPNEHCAHVAIPGAPGRVLAMIVDGRIARVEVRDTLVATGRGARVGDAEARIDSLYAGRVRVEPHKYTDGHYLVVTQDAPSDTAHRLIFETDGARVTEYRAGALPAVGWVEGCS